MSLWRSAGLTYLRYSQIAAGLTRKCTKTTGTPPAAGSLKLTSWKDGKAIKSDKTVVKDESMVV
ncbi:hypothetical protein M3Y95_00731800 [Aphelenchoides besseyi]|nr:hypothetical protein M3Y95_00731800 [Aphelenchoides besseyi]